MRIYLMDVGFSHAKQAMDWAVAESDAITPAAIQYEAQQKQWPQISWAAKGLRIYFNMLPTQLIGIPGAKRLSKRLKKATS